MPQDVALQTDIALRLIAAALLGSAVGLEREIHGHPAGMRTHMLVSLGSAMFTVLSIYGFPRVSGTALTDTSRIAAQIVSGIGFLGAGAIIKYGTNIRGLTTAASLWVIASIGMAAGAGAFVIALVGSAIAIVALWPLHLIVARLSIAGGRLVHLHLELDRVTDFAGVSQVLLDNRVNIVSVHSERAGEEGQSMDLELRLPTASTIQRIMSDLGSLSGVRVGSLSHTEEA